MKITFHEVMPVPLKSITHGNLSLWGKTCDFHSGQNTCVDAASGKGKTTFTHILAGIRKDYEGEVYFDEKNIRSFTSEEWANIRREKIAFIFQDLQLFDQLTVMENLLIKNELVNLYSEDELSNMLNRLGISDKKNAPCRQISMGQQQRVAIIRALCQPFELLVMDEPFSHLDEKTSIICLELILEVCKLRGGGMIMTTLGNSHGLSFHQTLFI
jgi:ABC-type lipoprotein export system ATPase subunit